MRKRCSPLGRLAGLGLWATARGEHAALIRELGARPIDYQREDFTRVLPGGQYWRPNLIPVTFTDGWAF